ncbi:WG repeat-containing protein [Isobaculum melis]|uniref:WG containing repeat-containing protein n=1 Tax=Isobaculum melis TaxID=142588 RepID=A0A1H9Q3U8_9LACT|nr:WG repeat-containing protein [Isobaculum melis]SER54619.1 WG containing repeat-containing protein [Isobaculum melis]
MKKQLLKIMIVFSAIFLLTGCKQNKPASILPQLESAYNEKDLSAIVSCFEPSAQKMMNGMLDLVGGAVGIDSLKDMMPFFSQVAGQSDLFNSEDSDNWGTCKLKEINTEMESDDKAILTYEVTLSYKDKETTSFETAMTMKKVEDKWYIANIQEKTEAQASSESDEVDEAEAEAEEKAKKSESIKPSISKATIIKEPFAEEVDPYNEQNQAWYQELNSDSWSLIAADGTILQKNIASEFKSSGIEGLSWFKEIAEESSAYWGLIDSKGSIIQQPFIYNTCPLEAQRPVIIHGIKDSGGYEILTDNGTKRIKIPENLYRHPFTDSGYTWYQENNQSAYGILDKNGTMIKEPFIYDISGGNEDVYTFEEPDSDKRGMVNSKDGSIIKPPFANKIEDFELGVAWYSEYNDVYGLIDQTGKVLFPPKATGYSGFNASGIAWFQEGSSKGLWGLVNLQGKVIKEPFAQKVEDFSEFGYGIFKGENDLYGFIDDQGEIVKEPFAKELSFISENYVLADNYLYAIDGEKLSETIMKEVQEIGNSDLLWYREYQEWGLVNNEGDIVALPFANAIPAEQKDIFQTFETIPFKGENGWGVVSKYGHVFSENFSREELIFSENGAAWCHDEQEGLYGIMNNLGEYVKEPFAEQVTPFNRYGIAWYYKDGLWGIIKAE